MSQQTAIGLVKRAVLRKHYLKMAMSRLMSMMAVTNM